MQNRRSAIDGSNLKSLAYQLKIGLQKSSVRSGGARSRQKMSAAVQSRGDEGANTSGAENLFSASRTESENMRKDSTDPTQ